MVLVLLGEFEQSADADALINQALQHQDHANTQSWTRALTFHFPEFCSASFPESPDSDDNVTLNFSTIANMSRADVSEAEDWIPLLASLTFN